MSESIPAPIPFKQWNDGNLNFFARYDGPLIEDTIELGNHGLRKMLSKHFEYTSRCLYFISAFGRYLLGYEREEYVIQAENIAQSTINNAIANMQKLVDQAMTALNDAGIKEKVKYGKSVCYEIHYTSPGSRAYAKLIALADHFYSLNSLLWMHGEIQNQAKFANEGEARRIIKGVVGGIAGQFAFILKKTREKDRVVAAEAGDHDEEQLAKAAEESVDREGAASMMHHGRGSSEAEKSEPIKLTEDSAGSAVAAAPVEAGASASKPAPSKKPPKSEGEKAEVAAA